ncbi:hypothetical protein ACJZ2D_009377 [Fusarium nematophilum]
MYYSSGNYEAFARPLKPEGIEDKTAWIVGSGLAGLSTAAFLVRDAQMPGKNITILEELSISGGALDGLEVPEKGFVIRGGREMEAHFECLWDLFRSVPSLEEEGASTWHSALEMKLYLHRFVNHIQGMPDFSTIKFTRYNQYESLVLPLHTWLEEHGVKFQFSTEVQDIDFTIADKDKQATYIHWTKDGVKGGQELGPNDLLFMTIGSLTENSDLGDHKTPATLQEGPAPAWDLWRRIAAKSEDFGRPDVFGGNIPATKWQSATVTTLDKRIPEYIHKVCKRDPFTGAVVTGGIVTVRDSTWIMSWTVNRQPHFKSQPKDQVAVWVYSLLVEKEGDYVKKPMQECTGEEIVQEWLYHLGVPETNIPELAATGAKCVPVMMPYVTSFFMPRQAGDRPLVVPEGSKNFAFIGQFAETTRDTIFTTEYSVRTGMESVYQLAGVDRGVPEVWGSTYDVRVLLEAMSQLRDGKALATWLPEHIRGFLIEKLQGSQIGQLLHEHHLV